VPSTPTRGRLLLATPELSDPNFFRSVVLVLEHTDDGALGLVLNRPTDVRVDAVLPDWADPCSAPACLFVGGPVQPDAAIALARRQGEEDDGFASLFDDLVTVDLERDAALLAPGIDDMRIFLGYAGWGAGQLDDELEAGGWVVVDAEGDDAFASDPGGLWRATLGRQDGRVAILALAPEDPSLN
jgi:putative transcriptional regulator